MNLDLVHRLGDGDGFIAIGIVDQNHQIRERMRHEFFADNAQMGLFLAISLYSLTREKLNGIGTRFRMEHRRIEPRVITYFERS